MSDRLDEVLRTAQDLGLLGPRPIEVQRQHAEAFCRLALAQLESHGELRWLDLGSGGGLPGLVLARAARGSKGVLLDSQHRRTAVLAQSVAELELGIHVEVVTARAEDVARDPGHRERYDLVVARSFGPPAVTAECAAAFLKPAAHLAVSEPPEDDPTRWNAERLEDLGLLPPEVVHQDGATAALIRRTGDPVSPKWPRRPGIPQKRPLW